MIAPKPKDVFWQAAAGDWGRPATSQPESGDTRIGSLAGASANSRPRRRRRSVREVDHAGRGAAAWHMRGPW